MTVSALTKYDVAMFGKVDLDADDIELIEKIFLPAAKAHVIRYTGLSVEDVDKYEDLTIAVCALCVHMYDNRSVAVDGEKENKVVKEIVGKYSANLIPRGDFA